MKRPGAFSQNLKRKGLGFPLSKTWKMWRLSKFMIIIFHFKWKPSQFQLTSASLEQND